MGAWQPHGFGDQLGNQLNIDTPEQVELEFAVAGSGSRFVAILLDHLIQLGGFLLLLVLTTAVMSSLERHFGVMGNWTVAVFIALNFLLIWGYFTLFEAFWNGQTPGKHVMKLRVIKDSGRQITFFEALSRNLIRFVDYLPALYLVGVIAMLCTRRNQRLGDLTAGTIVVHERADEQPLLVGSGTSILPVRESVSYARVPPGVAESASLLPADSVARLGPDDLLLIETFFARALDLSLSTRAEIAAKIAAKMAAKMFGDGNAVPPGNPERFLESIAFAMRSGAHSRR